MLINSIIQTIIYIETFHNIILKRYFYHNSLIKGFLSVLALNETIKINDSNVIILISYEQ